MAAHAATSDSRQQTKYATFETEDGLVLYDRDDPSVWIESDTVVDVRT